MWIMECLSLSTFPHFSLALPPPLPAQLLATTVSACEKVTDKITLSVEMGMVGNAFPFAVVKRLGTLKTGISSNSGLIHEKLKLRVLIEKRDA